MSENENNSNYEENSFLRSPVPDGVTVCKGFGHAKTDIVLPGNVLDAVVRIVSGLPFLFFGGVFLFSGGFGKTESSMEAIFSTYIMEGLFFLIGAGLIVSGIKLICTKTILRLDMETGNFSMFTQAPWGESSHVEFLRSRAWPEVTWTSGGKGRTMYRLVVYPSKGQSRPLGFFEKRPNTFVAKTLSYKLCYWARDLIFAIQGKEPPKDSALMGIFNF